MHRAPRQRMTKLLGLIALLVVSGLAHAADPSTLFFTENSSAFWMTTRDGNLYWYGPACSSELLPPTVFIRSEPTAGTTARTVFNPPGCTSDAMFNNTRIAIDDTDIYWADGNNQIVRLPRGAPPPSTATNFSPYSAVPRDLMELAVDGTFVYWLESRFTSGRVVRIPKVAGGGAPLTYSIAQTTNLNALRIDNLGRAYVLSGATLIRLTPDPSSLTFTPQPIGAPGLVSRYTVAGDRIYWVESDAAHQRLMVKSTPLSDPTQIALNWTITTTGNINVWDMKADDSNVYWIENQPGKTYAIVRMPRAGGNPVVLASYGPNTNDAPWQLAASSGFLFWSMTETAQIRRLPIDSPGLDLKTDGAAPQAVQVIQGTGNDILLVAGKPTFARAFGRIDPATTAQTAIFVNPSATLAGSRDGQALPGSPLAPLSNLAQLNVAIDTRDVSNGLLFELPETWTHGTVTLTATINPAHTVLESNFSNNTSSGTVSFQDASSYCLQYVPIQTETGTITGPSASIMSFIDRTVSVYPLTGFQVDFMGGPGLRRPRLPFGFIQGSDPWKLDSDFELGYLLWTMWWAYNFDTGYACLGAGTSVLGPVDSAVRYGMSGMDVMAYLMKPGIDPIATPYEGLAGLAHELGHQFGRSHIACPASGPNAPSGTDGSYPYPPCFIDNNTATAHVGFDTLRKTWLLPGSTADMMTYSSPLWVSDYTYKALADHLGLRTALRATAPAPGVGQQALIGGLLGTQSLIGYAFPLDAEQAQRVLKRLEGKAPPSSEFELHVRNARGETLSRAPLRVAKIQSEGGGDASMFFNLVALPADAARIDVVVANGTTLLSRAAGPAAPRVSITTPRKGAKIGDTLFLAWRGTDADKDPLLFTVRYSPDRGKTWSVLASNTSDRSLQMPTTRLAGGKQALLEVTASDGIHSGSAIAGPFELARHAPEALIYDRSGRALGPAVPAVIAQSQALELRGFGNDAEDGTEPPTALQWKLSGPLPASASGTRLRVDDLPPGRYLAALAVTDSDKNQTEAKAAVTVLPKQVAEAGGLVRFDGRCTDMIYARDADPLRLRFASGALVEARFVRVGDALFVCLAGLPLPESLGDLAGIRVRTVDPGGDRLAEKDIGFFVRADGVGVTAHGTASGGWAVDPAPVGLAAAAAVNDRSWSAELRIDVARLGGWNRQVRVQAAQYAAGDTANGAWPRGSRARAPRTWGVVVLGRLAQTITFAPLPDRNAALDGFDLTATASSGLAVQYSAGGVCNVQGNRLSLNGSGACTVVASQPGDSSFAVATPVTRTFLVCTGGKPIADQRHKQSCECKRK